ncbi:unnamed protein product [Schistosoma margrebowiei]|uniref:Uncharacterized protein n=1 Tax=Schistosoma margrebowiei TaxID=48269 RepID=A0A183N7N1_9TREM|nr:unnamed protein product [Schistosoma margrebowiei]
MEVAKRIGLQPVGWIFTDLVAQNSSGNGVVKHFRGTVDTFFLSAEECITAAHLQNLHPNICRLSPDGCFGSKFTTVVVTGDASNHIHFEAYQVSNQAMALVKDNILVPTYDAPELGYVKETTKEQFVPEVFYANYDLLPLPASEFKKLLLMCTSDVQFQFNNTIYRQIDGVAMGSPLGPILADIFMGYLENMLLKQTISETTEYSIYVDDTFIVCNNKQHEIRMLKHFNNAHPNIQFTMEHEQNDMFHFLDVAIKRRRDGTVQRSLYRKSTWNGIYLNFNSFCPLSYKKALVKTLFYRAERICTTDKLEEELVKVEKCLRDNFYPQKFIDEYKKRKENNIEVITVNKKPISININFKGDEVANTINRRLNTALARTYPAAKLQILYKTTCSITQSKVDKHPFHTKDKYGNRVTRVARPLPVEFLLTNMPTAFPIEPFYTMAKFPDDFPTDFQFPIENRECLGQIQVSLIYIYMHAIIVFAFLDNDSLTYQMKL